jgi:hypothetical protein
MNDVRPAGGIVEIHRKFLEKIESDPMLAPMALVPPDRFARHLPSFCRTYYKSGRNRVLVLGINPGRRGSGQTGVPFCDGHILEKFGVENEFSQARETTSRFMGDVIQSYGGATAFFSDVLLSALFPVGLIESGKNVNYYDIPSDAVRGLALQSFEDHAGLTRKPTLIVIGTGKNLNFINELNRQLPLFTNIIGLEHPRFIEQYNRAHRGRFIEKYVSTLRAAAAD